VGYQYWRSSTAMGDPGLFSGAAGGSLVRQARRAARRGGWIGQAQAVPGWYQMPPPPVRYQMTPWGMMPIGDPGLFSGIGKLFKGVARGVGRAVGAVGKVAGAASRIPGVGLVAKGLPFVGTALAGYDVARGVLGGRGARRAGTPQLALAAATDPRFRQRFGLRGPGGPFAPEAYYESERYGAPPATGAMLAAGKCASGWHLAKDGSGKCVRNRRMNPLNPRALSRACTRLRSGQRAARMLGLLQLPRRKKAGCAKCKAPTRKK